MRKRLGACLAAFAAMTLIAAGEPTQPVGTAQTQLTAVELDITGVASPVQGLTLLDVVTFASTDTDTVRNAAGAPFSTARISPIQVNGEDLVDPVTVRSDGDTSESTATLNENVGLATIALNPVGMTATAGSDAASATVSAATAKVTALSDALGIEFNHVPGMSSVDANGATATSGIGVSGVELSLGELLPVDLGDLPLDTLLDLANLLQDQLSVTGLDLSALDAATTALEGAVGDLTGLISDYDTAVGELNSVIGQINTLATQLAPLETDLATADALVADVSALDVSLTNPALVSEVEALIATHNWLAAEYAGAGVTAITTDVSSLSLADLVTLLNGSLLQTLADGAATLQGHIAGLVTTVEGSITTLGAAGGPLDEALGAVQGALDAIQDFLATTDLEKLISDLVAELNGLLDLVPDLLNGLDASSLLDVDPIGVNVSATATADSATPSITCGGGRVAVAGIEIVPNIDGCNAVSGAADTLTGALASVADVLGTLTDVEVPTPALDLFVERRESSGTDGAYRTATAGITALILDLPSVDLDAVVGGTLDGALSKILGADIVSLLGDLEAALGTALDTVNAPTDLLDDTVETAFDGLSGAASTVQTTVTSVSGVDTAEGALDALLADLADLIAGAVPDTGLKTPGIDLKVDPVATVEFAPGTSGAPTPPTAPDPASGPGPAPAPDPAPSLPATGGGLALLGALAIAGGLALRRRD
ncbi:MAG: hypothetical protein KY437_07650 [Actinobacteria bacterium]|nr:hypothetical protein [Actinomycetota bacterium]